MSNARYVTSKIASDLDLMRLYYGWPPEEEISKYAEEAAILIAGRYLKSVEYGFRRDGNWIFVLKYESKSDGTLQTDDRPGRVPYGVDISGATGYSYLIYSTSYHALPESERKKIEATLPFSRTSAPNPTTSNGYWEQSRSYSSNGEGVIRNIFRPV